ncbi:hypothetical protein CLAFUW4_14149 [Fulvia fulva]|uniref:NAD-dependent epimerase/dehydratase domain-containing protein n=1 Tax=Passalora fulva TaxID=5499 RepID=A0A9Q8PKN8_PASFU|nr:uncharacterized protein CLAFUR5_13983 [Fulvia fulva]KAK4610130.1 hypothetical protein CLAFUR4_14152 [Fulvia fulva]KAK4611348.1 hypothetical protein CLAFUR0_14156 [Fulvia fulva]UJO24185.1 hypothetical protein CLAFUR5_13983 [Fulvia fulva]WPV22315.1 hypothetical protein CLAFUW4_14149 [Fulvia fulva]WPV36781.1 hypothetical protein CLAFUW7_14160 [Fulvia fulva]
MATKETVLVTGGSGFIGSHCLLRGLEQGYRMRTTIRNLKRTDEVRQSLRNGGATQEQADSVQFFAADLMKDDGWLEACTGCDYVLHVASPFPAGVPKHEDELVAPARDGTLRALRFAKQVGTVKRVVVTSSFASVGYGHGNRGVDKPFTEEDWTVLDGSKGEKVFAYPKSKTVAERSAWDWIQKEGGSLELATVNPVGVFGPVLSGDFATSVEIVSRLLKGEMPVMPQLAFGIVDVRDVAEVHFKAMTDPKAKNQRFIACADGTFLYIKDIANILKKELPAQDTKKVPSMVAPNFLVKLMGFVDPAASLVASELGKRKACSNETTKTTLGMKFRSTDEAIVSCAKSLKEHGVVKS